ncbi:MAG TPA: TolC family protein [Tepidisphaeraceae bacterium]|nr:TolC family protein [Tepidisphaeraceae bacterium]
MPRLTTKLLRRAIVLAPLVLTGCVLRPAGTDQEIARLDTAGAPYRAPVEHRALPDLPPQPTWRDVLRRALLANGDLEAAYFEWAAAVHRIDVAGAWPTTNLSLGFEYMFSADRMKSWDRTTITAGPDAMANLALPVKTVQAGRVALERARAAGERFAARKFDVQKRVLQAWLDYAMLAEQVRIQRDNVALLKLISDTAADRVRAGGPQQDLLKSQIEHRLAENELTQMEAERAAMGAMLAGMLALPPTSPPAIPAALPDPRPLPADDARLIAAAVDANPELAALARDVAAGRNALELARLQYLPDVNPIAAATGSVSQAVGAMISVPINHRMIRASVEENRAMLRATQAMARQTRSDRAASFVAALYALRAAEHHAALYRDTVLPKAEQALASSRQAYAAGQVSFVELIDSQRTLLDVRLLIAQARTEREKRLAELEALAGVDVETLGSVPPEGATRPAPDRTQ